VSAGEHVVTLGSDAADVDAVYRALPEPGELAPGTRVVVLGEPASAASLRGKLLAAFGARKVVPRVVRCTALVARGYVRVGSAIDPQTRRDVAWGHSPAATPRE